jgi:hypothetical protein
MLIALGGFDAQILYHCDHLVLCPKGLIEYASRTETQLVLHWNSDGTTWSSSLEKK